MFSKKLMALYHKWQFVSSLHDCPTWKSELIYIQSIHKDDGDKILIIIGYNEHFSNKKHDYSIELIIVILFYSSKTQITTKKIQP